MTYLFTMAVLALTVQSPFDSAQGDAIALQVALDRAGFSCGVIDGRPGANTRRAMDAYRQQHGRNPERLGEPLGRYQITSEDVAGPFAEQIPTDLMEQAKLPALSYQSVVEALAERFHTTPQLLRSLNPTATFGAGDAIMVPNVEPLVLPAPRGASTPRATGTSGRGDAPRTDVRQETPQKENVVVRVSRSMSSLTVTRADGGIIFFAPVTTGSERDLLPLGEWKVNAVQYNPSFRYNPDLFWDADPAHSKATIPPGPNGPVGLVWIDISKEHYGLHGSPEPARIGHTQSHGCVRLTNWDAVRLAGLVKPGTTVLFTK